MKATQQKIIVGCGIWLMVLPFTGFPRDWKVILTVATGLVVAYVGALLWRRFNTARSMTETKTRTFTETA